jgi:hypothetical protein
MNWPGEDSNLRATDYESAALPLSYRAATARATLALEIGSNPMLIGANAAFSETIAILVTFLGVGVVVNVLIVYIVGVVLAERRQNQERQQGGS